MALEGTIRDFGLADIFQLIGIQRKTGLLTLDNDKETVVVKFIDGQVVGADNIGVKLEDLLGSVLVRTGRITQPQLDQALSVQRNTLQRLGYILVDSGYISEVDLKEALRTQVTQIVYRLFRWREGRYKFVAADHVDYDQNFTPISAETILMEGARMVDEWPIIERRIKSDKMVFRRTAAAERLDQPVQSIVDADIQIDLGFDPAEAGKEEITLSTEERDVLRLVDGKATVLEVSDHTTLGEFDTYRILCELLTRNLIEEVEEVEEVAGAPPTGRVGKMATGLLLATVAAAAALSLATLSSNPFTPWRLGVDGGETDRLRTFASRGRLERIERAIQVFYLDTGTLPTDLDILVANGYIASPDVLDPWGRQYVFHLEPNRYTLAGMDAEGLADKDLTVNRRFSAAQRMILVGEGSGTP